MDQEKINQSDVEIDFTVDPSVSSPINTLLLGNAAKAAAAHRGYSRGQIGIRVTDDETIRQINSKHLGHDYATDVISFGYTAEQDLVDGEMVISIDTARIRSLDVGWSIDHELALYVVHGTLHIAGMDDQNETDRAAMRESETEVMDHLGIHDIARCGVEPATSMERDQ